MPVRYGWRCPCLMVALVQWLFGGGHWWSVVRRAWYTSRTCLLPPRCGSLVRSAHPLRMPRGPALLQTCSSVAPRAGRVAARAHKIQNNVCVWCVCVKIRPVVFISAHAPPMHSRRLKVLACAAGSCLPPQGCSTATPGEPTAVLSHVRGGATMIPRL